MASYLRRAERMRRRKPPQRKDNSFIVPPVCVDISKRQVEDYVNVIVGSLRGRFAESKFHAKSGTGAAKRAANYAQTCVAGRRVSRHQTGGRSGRPTRGLTAMVGRGFLQALSEVNLDSWFRSLFITIAPPPWVDQIAFLRCAEEYLRDKRTLRVKHGKKNEITEYPCDTGRWKQSGSAVNLTKLHLDDRSSSMIIICLTHGAPYGLGTAWIGNRR